MALTHEQQMRRVAHEIAAVDGGEVAATRQLRAQLRRAGVADLRGPEGPVALMLIEAHQVSARGSLVLPPDSKPSPQEQPPRATRVVAVMAHTTADGLPRVVEECGESAAAGVVHRIITDLAVLDVTEQGLVIRELAPRVSARDVQEHSEPTLRVPPDVRETDSDLL